MGKNDLTFFSMFANSLFNHQENKFVFIFIVVFIFKISSLQVVSVSEYAGLVRNPEDRFSHDRAHINMTVTYKIVIEVVSSSFGNCWWKLSYCMTKSVKAFLISVKIQIGLGICPV